MGIVAAASETPSLVDTVRPRNVIYRGNTGHIRELRLLSWVQKMLPRGWVGGCVCTQCLSSALRNASCSLVGLWGLGCFHTSCCWVGSCPPWPENTEPWPGMIGGIWANLRNDCWEWERSQPWAHREHRVFCLVVRPLLGGPLCSGNPCVRMWWLNIRIIILSIENTEAICLNSWIWATMLSPLKFFLVLLSQWKTRCKQFVNCNSWSPSVSVTFGIHGFERLLGRASGPVPTSVLRSGVDPLIANKQENKHVGTPHRPRNCWCFCDILVDKEDQWFGFGRKQIAPSCSTLILLW